MRLRLSVLRHQLPQVKILWSLVKESSNRPETVSQLLEQVNEVIPLESEDWGLEDYVVEVGGFECLHYFNLQDILKDEDCIYIRPLRTTEVRERTFAGRYQIHAGGMHLLDGIPFGRSNTRRLGRPSVHIPPRKRRRVLVEEDEGAGHDGDEEPQFLLIDQDEYDMSHAHEQVPPDAEAHIRGAAPQRSQKRKRVGFSGSYNDQALTVHGMGISEDDESDGDFNPDEEDSEGQFDSEQGWSANGSDEDVSAVDEEHESDGEKQHVLDSSNEMADGAEELDRTEAEKSHISVSDTSDDSDESEAESESDEDSDSQSVTNASSDEDSAPSIVRSKPSPKTALAKESNLKRKSVLLHTFSRMQNPPDNCTVAVVSPPGEGLNSTRKRNHRRADTRRLRKLIDRGILPSGSSFADLRKLFCAENKTRSDEFFENASSEDPSVKRLATTIEPSTEKEPGEARDWYVGTFPGIDSNWVPGYNPQEHHDSDAAADNQDFWRRFLEVTAVECGDEDVKLSEPPFPFVQRWDPQQRKRTAPKFHKKKKRSKSNSEYYGGGELLEGDDSLVRNDHSYRPSDGYPGALDYDDLGGREEAADSDSVKEPDLPPLPSDINSLPLLQQEEAVTGKIIAFKQLEVSQATNWTPSISAVKTAVIRGVEPDGTLSLVLARRDRPKRKIRYDENGNRVYDKFEMEGYDDDEDGAVEGLLELSFHELAEPRVLAVEASKQRQSNSLTVSEHEGASSASREGKKASYVIQQT